MIKTTFGMKKTFYLGLICAAMMMSSSCFAQAKTDTDSKKSSFKYVKQLNSVFDFVQKNYVDEVDPQVLYEGALKGMMEALGDPYSVYLDSDYMRDLKDTTNGSFGGVGLTITKPTESTPAKPAYVEVSTPLEDAPGAKAGIKSGDYIVAIEGEPTETMTMNEVLSKLRGPVGTPVNITIKRGETIRFDVKLVRALIEVPTAKFGMIEGTKIGYVRLIEFTPETPNRLQDAMDLFQQNGYTSMIIDLRDNPGGLITSVVNVADKFIDEGLIVSTKSRLAYENMEFKASPAKTTVKKDIPIIVLINGGSASASEILSGALKDYHLAYLIGERTYGKGSVQQVINLSEEDGFKLTMARYYTPSDVNIDKIGIPPDREVINFPKLTKEQEASYEALIKNNIIEDQYLQNPTMSENEIAVRAFKLAKEYGLEARILRRLLRNEVLRTQETPLYDLDYDLQLKEAIRVLESGDYNSLIKSAKTLKELQGAVELEAKDKKDINK